LFVLLAITLPRFKIAATTRQSLNEWVSKLSKWSLLDVLVIAILIVTIKVKGLVSVEAAIGTHLFCGAILLSMVASGCVKLSRTNHVENPVYPIAPVLEFAIKNRPQTRRWFLLTGLLAVAGLGLFF
jgi:hypothetical protein